MDQPIDNKDAKTKIHDLPAELISEIIGYLDFLPFEEFRDLREVSYSLERHHLVLTNIENPNEIQYFTPGNQRTPHYFKSVNSLTKTLTAHLKKYNVEADEVTLFIEYSQRDSIPFHDWYIDRIDEDPELMRQLNTSLRSNANEVNKDSEIYQLLLALTGMKFNVEIFFTATFSPFSFRSAIWYDIKVILPRCSLSLNSYSFFLDADKSAQLNITPWKRSAEPDIELYIFDPLLKTAVDIDVYKSLEVKYAEKEKQLLLDESTEHYAYGKGSSLVIEDMKKLYGDDKTSYDLEQMRIEKFADLDSNTHIVPLPLYHTEFKNLKTLTLNSSAVPIIKDYKFPNLESFQYVQIPMPISGSYRPSYAIIDNEFPKLKRLYIRHKNISQFHGNTFGMPVIEELELSTKFHSSYAKLIIKTKKLKINGHDCMSGLLLDVFDKIEEMREDSVLEELILSDFSSMNSVETLICHRKLSTLQVLKVDSINECNSRLKRIHKNFRSFNTYLDLNPFEVAQAPLDLRETCPKLHTLFVLNCNILHVKKPESLKSVIFTQPSPLDDRHRFNKFTTFESVVNEVQDFSDDCIIYHIDATKHFDEQNDIDLRDRTIRTVWFLGRNIKLEDIDEIEDQRTIQIPNLERLNLDPF
ncbi:hypothetical protein WICPIJ_004420 [Wickerhamomyces pijperi]|uniref:F-box domain-containing protein n=1 Tax=Wickerhamomyces pijperi TaxID=599730 RepID=A0A9P8Q7Z9_WICPI|nr:hypothetical protein WICPIJ_004420 [Wickerhamomyces pijperi]